MERSTGTDTVSQWKMLIPNHLILVWSAQRIPDHINKTNFLLFSQNWGLNQGPELARKVFYHWAKSPTPKMYLFLCSCYACTYMSVWGCQIFWNWRYRQLWAAMKVLGLEPWSSGRIASALNPKAISSAQQNFHSVLRSSRKARGTQRNFVSKKKKKNKKQTQKQMITTTKIWSY